MKLIQDAVVTPANVHDRQVFEDLLDTGTTDDQRRKRTVYADRAYRSEKHEPRLDELAMDSQIHETGSRAAPLTEAQHASNRQTSRVRARVEHLFGAQAAMGGHLVRTIGLMNLAYHRQRLVQLTACESRKLVRSVAGQHRIAAPGMACSGESPAERRFRAASTLDFVLFCT